MSIIGSGNRGRFSDRLKRMRYNRLYKKKKLELEDSEIMYKNFLKVVAVIPLMVAGNILNDSRDNKQKKVVNGKVVYVSKKPVNPKIDEKNIDERTNENIKPKEVVQEQIDLVNQPVGVKTEKVSDDQVVKKSNFEVEKGIASSVGAQNGEKLPEVDTIVPEQVDEIVPGQEQIKKEKNKKETTKEEKPIDIEKEEENKAAIDPDSIDEAEETKNPVKELEKKVINLIKKDLVKIVNTLEIYESELYILSEINGDEKTLEECRKNIAEVKKILSKIEDLKKKYDHLKDNYDFEYLLENSEGELADTITELRDLFGKEEVKTVVSDYKLLDAYKYLYTKVDEVKANTSKIEEEKLQQEEKLRKRDVDFDKLKEKVCGIGKVNDSYAQFVSQQNQFLSELSNKISNIDSQEVVSYKLRGFGKYVSSTFKYLGLLMLTPLRGVFPAIATQTVIAHDMVHNLRKQITLEEKRKMVYKAVDYENSINYAIGDLGHTSNLLDSTLEDLARLKKEYNEKFREYQGDFMEYHDVISKISSMQEAMINNRIKVEIMKNKAKTYLVTNDNKMKLVRKMNYDEENKDN